MPGDLHLVGILHIKAPRRRPIDLFSRFRVSPSAVERTFITDGDRVGYQNVPAVPYIDAEITSLPTRKWPKEITTIVAEASNGPVYVLQGAKCQPYVTKGGDLRMRFEGITCEEINT